MNDEQRDRRDWQDMLITVALVAALCGTIVLMVLPVLWVATK